MPTLVTLFPNLQPQPTSGLTFPWAEYNPHVEGTFDCSLGSDGVSLGMLMLINWEDLEVAVQELLGYSYRPSAGKMSRILPWQHPYFNQLWVHKISSIKGIRPEGKNTSNPGDHFSPGRGSVGVGQSLNTGPWTEYDRALLTLQFWRPPYFIRSDSDILDGGGNQQEWLRYVDRHWQVNTQMLCREGGAYRFQAGQGLPASTPQVKGAVGQKVTHIKLTKKWYQVPEACIFQTGQDQTPNGIPYNLLYTHTPTTNPITGYVYSAGKPIGGCVNSPIGGGRVAVNPPDPAPPPYVYDDDPTKRLFGCFMGTLLYEGVEITPTPLQLPAYLMQIPAFANNEAISQQQYDVTFHFDLFDPPTKDGLAYQGHNLMPYSGDGLWYAMKSDPPPGGIITTAFQYADLSDLWDVL
jgi:hypothetical protein